jgi:AbrB family looped-hinge helix DNA binding protein
MLRRITRNKQVTLPKEFMERLHLSEGDYVAMECEEDAIRLRAVVINDFSHDDYKKLAARLDRLKNEPGTQFQDSTSARNHLKSMMD